MNSRSNSVNESDLVNFSTEISTINQLDTKEALITFPFDHIYACHSESSDRQQIIQLDKEVEISTHCVVSEDDGVSSNVNSELRNLTRRVNSLEDQNKHLRELLICHLDLIQQQNDIISKKDKLFQTVKQENETLKSRLNRIDRRVTLNQRNNTNTSPLVHVPQVTSSHTTKPENSQIMLNTFSDLLLPNKPTELIFDGEIRKPDTYNIERKPSTTGDVPSYMPTELSVLSILDSKDLNCPQFTMIDSKPQFLNKEAESENRQEAVYTVTTGNSNSSVVQRIQRSRRKGTSSFASINRSVKKQLQEHPETSKSYPPKCYDKKYPPNKRAKMINSYGKLTQNGPKKSMKFTGSLSDRLQLIDTTPTGDDPYQLGEADMREQSPIPKLMLQKSHQRLTPKPIDPVKAIFQDDGNDDSSDYDITKIKLNRYNLTNTYMHPSEIKKEDTNDSLDLEIVKNESDDWSYTKNSTIGDYSYGEHTGCVIPSSIDSVEFQDLFPSDQLYQGDFRQGFVGGKGKINRAKTICSSSNSQTSEKKHVTKRSRKRALSTTSYLKSLKRELMPKLVHVKPKANKCKTLNTQREKSPIPGAETDTPYHTHVGDPDVSWYLGLDPNIKTDSIDQTGLCPLESTVEVPRWREKLYTSIYTMEGTENLDDKMFEKRHSKLEAEERRQLRWHMRRVREQRHVERLRQRQRDWCNTTPNQRSTFTIWPQPLRDLEYIEITDSVPVNAFGDALPALPKSDFVLPWIRSSKACRRANRATTLH